MAGQCCELALFGNKAECASRIAKQHLVWLFSRLEIDMWNVVFKVSCGMMMERGF